MRLRQLRQRRFVALRIDLDGRQRDVTEDLRGDTKILRLVKHPAAAAVPHDVRGAVRQPCTLESAVIRPLDCLVREDQTIGLNRSAVRGASAPPFGLRAHPHILL